MTLRSERSEIHRLPARGHYDRETIFGILDTQFLCHISWIRDGQPRIIPTAYGRIGEHLYIHGSVKSGMLEHLSDGAEVAVAVTVVDGIVLARSLFHSSMNYRSVVLYCQCEDVADQDDKLEALQAITERIWPGRWDEARVPDAGELLATQVVRLSIVDGAAKIRTGPPKDNTTDHALDIWAGVIPVAREYGAPVPDPDLRNTVAPSPSLMAFSAHFGDREK